MRIYTMGFSQKSAKRFFELLRDNEVDCLVDVRLNNVSQLSGFAKSVDLQYSLLIYWLLYLDLAYGEPGWVLF